MEQPVLWLGMAGFPAGPQERLSAMLKDQPSGWPLWRSARFHEADAWCIDGSRIRVLKDGTVKVAGSPGAEPTALEDTPTTVY